MKSLALKAVLPLLFSFATIAAAQSDPTIPPVKMGLWESDVTVTMSGMPNMPAGAMPPRTVKSQVCMSGTNWKESIEQLRGQSQKASCTMSNLQQDPHHISFDEDCTEQQGMTASVHLDMHYDSDQSMHGTTTMKMSGPRVPQGMTMNSTISTKFLSADCGDVKPGQARPAS
jgi:hypothetical protein